MNMKPALDIIAEKASEAGADANGCGGSVVSYWEMDALNEVANRALEEGIAETADDQQVANLLKFIDGEEERATAELDASDGYEEDAATGEQSGYEMAAQIIRDEQARQDEEARV